MADSRWIRTGSHDGADGTLRWTRRYEPPICGNTHLVNALAYSTSFRRWPGLVDAPEGFIERVQADVEFDFEVARQNVGVSISRVKPTVKWTVACRLTDGRTLTVGGRGFNHRQVQVLISRAITEKWVFWGRVIVSHLPFSPDLGAIEEVTWT